MISLTDLLTARKLDLSQPTIIVRHKDPRVTMAELIENGYFETYQSFQKMPKFSGKKYMIAFIGLESTQALFYKVYEITGQQDPHKVKRPPDFPPEYASENYYYDLKPLTGFEDLTMRVVIEWGKGTRGWVQNYTDREVLEILPEGFVKPFTGYLDFTLSFTELQTLFNYQDANREWKTRLSAVNGIYLILDKKTGAQYVGSAYGQNGIWGRWENYSKTGHGGNQALIELTKAHSNYARNFQWTILATLPSNMTNDAIIAYENMYKNKLGSKVHGLNRS